MNLRLLPNALTLFRIVAVIPLVVLLFIGEFRSALILAFVAGFSDLIDGFLARRFNWQTEFGGMLDPLADKLLMLAATVSLTILGHLPLWLVALVVLREVIIVGGGLYYHYRIEPVTASPTWLSKFNTFLLVALVLLVLLRLSGWMPPVDIETWLVPAVAATTIASGLHYVWIWSDKAKQANIAH